MMSAHLLSVLPPLGPVNIGVSAVGLVLNGATVAAFTVHGSLANSFSCIVVFLAVFDGVFSVANIYAMVMLVYRLGTAHSQMEHINFEVFAHFGYPMYEIAYLCSIYTTVALAMDRYLAVTRPVVHNLGGWKQTNKDGKRASL